MPLKLNAFSGGSVTLNPATTTSDFTLTLPAATGTVVHADTNGSVGIGTTSPNFRLDVLGAGTSTSHRGNVNALLRSNGSGLNSTLRLSDSVSNSTDLSLLGGTTQMSINGIVGLAFNDSGNLQFNSGYGSVATAYGCRAWVNFNGTGTVAIRSSGNVSSIGDLGTGTYQINFSTALVDANYSTVVSIGNGTPGSNDNSGFTRVYQGTTTQQQVGTVNPPSSAFEDYSRVNVAIFR